VGEGVKDRVGDCVYVGVNEGVKVMVGDNETVCVGEGERVSVGVCVDVRDGVKEHV
jgi:hypothetical protein